jgi:hypothetical protein
MRPVTELLLALLIVLPPGTFRSLSILVHSGGDESATRLAGGTERKPISSPQAPPAWHRTWTETTFTISQPRGQVLLAVVLLAPECSVALPVTLDRQTLGVPLVNVPLFTHRAPRDVLIALETLLV